MRNDIKRKLVELINHGVEKLNERDLIYLLSRTRKILDIDKRNGEYQYLRSYCNWALHHQLDNGVLVKKFAESGAFTNSDFKPDETDLMLFKPFFQELKAFICKELGVTDFNPAGEDLLHIRQLLQEVYKDTPVIVTHITRHKVTIKDGGYWHSEIL